MRLFFAGSEPTKYRDILIKNGARNGLESFWSLSQKTPPSQNSWPGHYLLDSGGYSARVRGVKIGVKKYADYLNKHQLKFAFNLDPPDNNESLHNLYYLQENTNTYIIPIYHSPEYKDPKWRGIIDYYAENYPFIGLGGIAGREVGQEMTEKFLNYVFSRTTNKVAVHGLGTTRRDLITKFPFYSVDSTSWMQPMRFGGSITHSKEMAKVRARKNHYIENVIDDIKWWVNLEEEMTRLWTGRGADWSDVDYEYCMKKRTLKKWADEPKRK